MQTMGWRVMVCVSWLWPLVGCTMTETAKRNLQNEPQLVLGDMYLQHKLKSLAKDALDECTRRYPRKTASPDFREGFIDGFVDYLDNGGPGVLPAVPPWKYRKTKFLTLEGQTRIQLYFQGFQYGQDVAIASGQRAFLIVPVTVTEEIYPPDITTIDLPEPPEPNTATPLAQEPAPESATLPLPRPIIDPLPSSTPGKTP